MDRLRRINKKYLPKIKEMYGKYIDDFDSIKDMTEDVYIVPHPLYRLITRDKTSIGMHYVNKDIIVIDSSCNYEIVVVHEFFHRLSNSKHAEYGGKISGFDVKYKRKYWLKGFNEILTQWLARSVVQNIEGKQTDFERYGSAVIDYTFKDISRKEALLEAYFTGDAESAFNSIRPLYKFDDDSFSDFLTEFMCVIETSDTDGLRELSEYFINNYCEPPGNE